MSDIRLNLGGGDDELAGYVNVDRKNGDEAYPLAYGDGEAAEIRASHLLEHFGYEQAQAVLEDWVRVLEPGGTLQIAVPDFDKVVQLYMAGKGKEVNIEGIIMGGHLDADDVHRALYTDSKLREAMEAVGLKDIKPWVSTAGDCAALPISLNLQGTKPRPYSGPQLDQTSPLPAMPAAEDTGGVSSTEPTLLPMPPVGQAQRNNIPRPSPLPPVAPPPVPANRPKCVAVMSTPRLAFSDNLFAMVETTLEAQMGLKKYTGAFWGQCLERTMIEAIDEGFEWLLAVDYDSVFPLGTVPRLLAIMERHPEADAIAALQINRRTGMPLLSVESAMGELEGDQLTVPFSLFAPELTQLTTAHFGLTLLRAAAIQKMPHPWFHSTPNEDGLWEERRVDEDIYFWNKWLATGNTLYSANHVILAHAELMLMWPSVEKDPATDHAQWRPLFQHPADFHKDGVPEGVWA